MPMKRCPAGSMRVGSKCVNTPQRQELLDYWFDVSNIEIERSAFKETFGYDYERDPTTIKKHEMGIDIYDVELKKMDKDVKDASMQKLKKLIKNVKKIR